MESIKEVYSKVEEDKKNKVKENSNIYKMSLEDFIDEHKRLIKILKEGSREELLAEAKKQEEELEKCLEDHGMSELEDVEEED